MPNLIPDDILESFSGSNQQSNSSNNLIPDDILDGINYNDSRDSIQVQQPQEDLLNNNPKASSAAIDMLLQYAAGNQPAVKAAQNPFVAGVQKGISNVGLNLADLGAQGLDRLVQMASGGDLGATQKLSQIAEQLKAFYGHKQEQSPLAGTAGEIVGSSAATAPLFASGAGVLGTAASGAASGYLASEPTATTSDKLSSAGIGAATGGLIAGVPGAIQGVKNVGRALGKVLTPVDDLANRATERTLNLKGGDFSKATPEDYFKQVDLMTKRAKSEKDNLYKIRNKIAEQEGATVDRSNLKSTIDNLNAEIKEGASEETIAALREAKNIYGNGKSVSYEKAQNLLSDVGSKISSASSRGDFALSNKLNSLREALLKDISSGKGSETLKSAQKAAEDFYRNNYLPLRNVNTKKIFSEKYTDDFYLSNALKSTLKDPDAVKASEDIKDLMVSAHVNSIKNASTTDGLIDLKKYADGLAKTLKENPTPLAEYATKINNLQDAIDVTKNLSKVKTLPSIMTGVLGFGTGYLTNPAVGASLVALQKVPFLYSAGKLLKNPEVNNLLSRKTSIIDPNMKAYVDKKIADSFWKNYNNIPKSLAVSAGAQGNTEEE